MQLSFQRITSERDTQGSKTARKCTTQHALVRAVACQECRAQQHTMVRFRGAEHRSTDYGVRCEECGPGNQETPRLSRSISVYKYIYFMHFTLEVRMFSLFGTIIL